MSDKPDPRSHLEWRPKDDQALVYVFMICPIYDVKQNLHKFLPSRDPSDCFQRFLKVVNDKKLQKRLINEIGQFFSLKIYLHFSESEHFVMSKIAEESPNNCTKFVARFPYLFNPIRKPGAITKAISCTKKEERSKSARICRYLKFVETMTKNFSSSPPIEQPSKSPKQLKDFEEFILSKFNSNDLCCLFGFFDIHKINKTRVVIGRSSPKIQSDIDLAPYKMQTVCRQHCIISFCSDTNFYMTVLGRDVIINTQVFYRGQTILLKNRDLIDIGGVPLMFYENPQLREQLNQLSKIKENVVHEINCPVKLVNAD